MFTVFDIGPWVIEADAAETRKQYEKPWDDRCDCGNCRNFSEAMNLLPAEKTRLFTQFGIRPSVCHDLGEIGKENGRPASLCGQLSDCRLPWPRLA